MPDVRLRVKNDAIVVFSLIGNLMKQILYFLTGLFIPVITGTIVYAANCTVSYEDTIVPMPVGGCGDPFKHGPYEDRDAAALAREAAGHPHPDQGMWSSVGFYPGWYGLKAGDYVDGSCANSTYPHYVTHVYFYYTGPCDVEELVPTDQDGDGIIDQEDLDYIDTKRKNLGVTLDNCRVNRDQNLIGK